MNGNGKATKLLQQSAAEAAAVLDGTSDNGLDRGRGRGGGRAGLGGNLRSLSKETDYSVVNRFDSHGGGWGYSGHSIEAVRFMVDADILLGGFGLFGGRGEYVGKIKLYDLGECRKTLLAIKNNLY